MPMIDLGKMPEKHNDCCGPIEVDKKKKPEKYYPSSYMDDVGNIDIDKLPIDKDIEIRAVIRIKSATKRIRKDKEEQGGKTSVDINYETRSIDFSPGSKKKEEKTETGTNALQEAMEEGLGK